MHGESVSHTLHSACMMHATGPCLIVRLPADVEKSRYLPMCVS